MGSDGDLVGQPCLAAAILRSLLAVVDELTGDHRLTIQIVATTLDLAEPRSIEAERAIARADALGKADSVSDEEVAEIDAELHDVLGDTDPYWMGWRFFRDQHCRRTP